MEIVEHRSFGRAATVLGMTQPALSRRIAALERDLGVSLFSRARRQIELTAEGTVFAREAIAVLAQAATAERVVRDATVGTTVHIKIGTRSISRFAIVPRAIRRLRERRPDISVSLIDPSFGSQIELLRKAAYDVTIIRGPVNLDPTLRSERLRTDPLVAALPDNHRLASRRTIDIRELAEEPFIELATYRAYGFKELVRGACANAGFIPNLLFEVDSTDALVIAVAAGMGVALMHDASADIPIEGIVFRPLRPKVGEIDLHAVWRADDRNDALAPLLHCFKQAAGSIKTKTV